MMKIIINYQVVYGSITDMNQVMMTRQIPHSLNLKAKKRENSC